MAKSSRKPTPEVAAYLAETPEEQRAELEELRALILAHFPDAKEELERFPVYTRGGQWLAGFAAPKKGTMFYLMDSATLDEFEPQLGKLRTGLTCVSYKATKARPRAELRALVARMLATSARRRPPG